MRLTGLTLLSFSAVLLLASCTDTVVSETSQPWGQPGESVTLKNEAALNAQIERLEKIVSGESDMQVTTSTSEGEALSAEEYLLKLKDRGAKAEHNGQVKSGDVPKDGMPQPTVSSYHLIGQSAVYGGPAPNYRSILFTADSYVTGGGGAPKSITHTMDMSIESTGFNYTKTSFCSAPGGGFISQCLTDYTYHLGGPATTCTIATTHRSSGGTGGGFDYSGASTSNC